MTDRNSLFEPTGFALVLWTGTMSTGLKSFQTD